MALRPVLGLRRNGLQQTFGLRGPRTSNGGRTPPPGYALAQRTHVTSTVVAVMRIDELEKGKDNRYWKCPIKLFENVE